MKNKYIKHLLECQCILPIYTNKTKKLYHKFPVFSELNEKDEITEKYVCCNNCDIIHKVKGVCKSEIMWGKEGYNSYVVSKEDIIFNLKNMGKERLVEILEKNKCDISTWEHCYYLVENEIEDFIVISKEEIENNISYKCLYISEKGFKIKNEISQRYL